MNQDRKRDPGMRKFDGRVVLKEVVSLLTR